MRATGRQSGGAGAHGAACGALTHERARGARCRWFVMMIPALVVLAGAAPHPFTGAAGAQQSVQQDGQVWVGDLPLMDGMRIEPELGVVFDAPAGRILTVFAKSRTRDEKVFSYYDRVLASLGWSGGAGNWRRDGELLTLDMVDTQLGRLWRISVMPE